MDKKNLMEMVMEIMNGKNGKYLATIGVIFALFGLDALVQARYSYSGNGVEITPGAPDPDDAEDADEAE